MLVLTRKLHESILIGDNIEIIVTRIKGKQVKLGITAPGMTILRKEHDYGDFEPNFDRKVKEEKEESKLSIANKKLKEETDKLDELLSAARVP